jgi:hypothetical protein
MNASNYIHLHSPDNAEWMLAYDHEGTVANIDSNLYILSR